MSRGFCIVGEFFYLFTDFGTVQSDEMTFDLSTLGESTSANDLSSLKSDVGKCLTDSLFKKLLDVEQVASHITHTYITHHTHIHHISHTHDRCYLYDITFLIVS